MLGIRIIRCKRVRGWGGELLGVNGALGVGEGSY